MAQIKVQGRLAFPELFHPKQIKGGASRFSACIIVEPGSESAKLIEAQMVAAAKEKWGDKGPQVLAALKKDKRVCFKTEERTNKDGEVYEGFEGMYSLNASNKIKPLLIDFDRRELSEEEGRLYAGCYVQAVVEVWAQNNPDPTIGRRINCTLLGVQYKGKGDAFGGTRIASVDAFDVLESPDSVDDIA